MISKISRIIFIIMMVGLLFQTTSCVMINRETEKSDNEKVNVQTQVTETLPKVITATVVTSVKPTMTETAIPIATETVVKKEIIELNNRIRDYLNSDGKYSEESLAKMAHLGFDYRITLEGNYLGLMKVDALIGDQFIRNTMDWSSSVYTLAGFQAIYLGGQLKNDHVEFYVGMRYKDGNRFVVPIGRPIFPDDGDVLYNGFAGSNIDGGTKNVISFGTSLIPSKLIDFPRWEKAYDQVMLFHCNVTPMTGFIREIMINDVYKERAGEALEIYDDSVSLCRGLWNESIDVRPGGDIVIDGADGNFPRFDSTNFNGVENSNFEGYPYIAYDTVLFVRP